MRAGGPGPPADRPRAPRTSSAPPIGGPQALAHIAREGEHWPQAERLVGEVAHGRLGKTREEESHAIRERVGPHVILHVLGLHGAGEERKLDHGVGGSKGGSASTSGSFSTRIKLLSL